MSNRDRLEDAGIINQNLTSEQYDAIESLTAEEVDQLIAVNHKLSEEIEEGGPVLEMPGRNPNTSS